MKSLRSETGFLALPILFLLAFVALVGFGALKTYKSHNTSTQPPIEKNTGRPQPSTPTPQADMKTFSGSLYALSYPAQWNQLPPIGAAQSPDTNTFSNRDSYTASDDAAVFLLADSRAGSSKESCYKTNNPLDYNIVESASSLGGVPATKYLFDAKPGKAPRFTVTYLAIEKGYCYSITIASPSAATRDSSLTLASTIAKSFKIK